MIWLIILTSAFVYFVYDRFVRQRCNIPGPIGLPILGYGPFLGSQPHITITNLSKKYGEIFQLQIGMKDVVVLNSISAIKEAFARPEFCSRPPLFFFEVFDRHGGAFSFRVNDQRYSFLRKCAVRALANFTKSNKSLTLHLADEGFAKLKSLIDATDKKPVNVKNAICSLVIYLIGNLSFGNQFDIDHPFVKKIQDESKTINMEASLGAIAEFIPLLHPFLRRHRTRFETRFSSLLAEEHRMIKNHQKRDDGAVLDIQDALDSMVDSTAKDEIRQKINIQPIDIKNVGIDLFGAGFSTVSEHLTFTLALLAYYPEVQEKLYRELMEVVGPSNPILIEHREQMSYFQAFQSEMIRFFSHIPLSLNHSTTEDVNFRGFFIPKNTIVLSNLYSVHYDPTVFPEPHAFKPERFLNSVGSLNDLSDRVVGFGVGLRKCPGELLARQELFLFTANLVVQYKTRLASFEGKSPFESDFGFSLMPKPFSCIFEARDEAKK